MKLNTNNTTTTGKEHDWGTEADPWVEYSYLDQRDVHAAMGAIKHAHESIDSKLTELRQLKSNRQSERLSRHSTSRKVDDVLGQLHNRNSVGAGGRQSGVFSEDKKEPVTMESISEMSHEERNQHAQMLFKRLRESLHVLRRELEIDEQGNVVNK